MKSHVLPALLALLLPNAAGGTDGALPDFEIAEEAVARGEILPLAEVIGMMQEVHPGRVIEVELEYSDGIRVYEIELITEDGRLIEVEMDAATGAILDTEVDDDD